MTPEATYLLVALPAEAKPLIHAFDLKRRQPDGAFPLYSNGHLSLLITGPGKCAAGKAVHYLHALKPEALSHWINLGIAGHATQAWGSCLLVDRVIDSDSGMEWPLKPFPDLPETALTPLRCVAEAELEYTVPAGYDMESAAIANALLELEALSRLHIVKVVSDNPSHPSERISARMINELISRHLPTITSLISRLNHAETQ
jgi:nucleoside phosphorylase